MPTGLIVGGWFATSVITKLINGLIDYAKDHKKMQLGLKDELKRLDKALPKIKAVVCAVDQGLLKEENPALEEWLWQLRDAADQADDMMDEMEYNSVKEDVEAGKGKANKVVSNLQTFLKRAVHKDAFLKNLKAAVKAIDNAASDVGVFYTLVQELANKQKEKDKSTINSRETTSVLDVETRVFGRQNEAEAIIKKLLNPECKTKEVNFAVLPIVGGGGVGKTTLAQSVYNAPEVRKHFNLRMWICVSNNFDVRLLTKKMYEIVFKKNADFHNFDLIHTELQEELKSKRFLVVFDDAWNDNDGLGWNKLFAPLKSGTSGSMILLTTRMETVADRLPGPNLMDSVFLEGLNEPDMWDLFEECAFRGEDPNDYTELVDIGKGIVKKLKGNPLAARTVGGALCSDLTEVHWRSILKSELWSPEQGTNSIMPALRLSYEHLPPHLKPCFSFCSIFPQDHVFIKDDLIYMWLALGLVPRDFNGGSKPEDVGLKYFHDLLKRSVFTPVDRFGIQTDAYFSYLAHASISKKTFTGNFIMHDLMHDLSTFVSQGECFRYDTSKSVHIPTTVRHLYIHVADFYQLRNFSLKNLRTLILELTYNSNHPEMVSILNIMLKGMRSLRILTFIAPALRESPESVGDLLHLRYLSSNAWILRGFSKSMSRLFLLETIVTDGLTNHKEAAEVLVKLNNLRHIIASQSFVERIANIGRLTSLQELCFRVGKDSGFKISELGEMKELMHLSISNINDVNTHEEAKQANLKNKVDLRELSLTWKPENRERKILDEMVLDNLEPYRNLKELMIRGYMGGRLPVWESESLSSLVKLEISDCHNLVSLDEGLLRNSGKMVALKELTIMNCEELKILKEGFRRFISLQILDVRRCPKIKIFDVLVFCPPSKLRLLRINGYVDNCLEKNSYVNDIIGNLNENFLCESSFELDPILHVEEAWIYVLDHPVESSDLEMRLSRMRDYIGRWPPIWLTKTLSMLEYLCIDGSPNYYQRQSNSGMDQLLELVRLDQLSNDYFPSVQIAYPSIMPAPEQIYLAMLDTKYIQYLKKLTVALCSKSFVMPPLPTTLKELRLHWLDMKVLPNNCGDSEANLSKALENVYSLSSLSLIHCKNISSLPSRGVFNRWKTLEKVIYCEELTSLESLRGLSSVRLLTICDCPKLVSAITSPSPAKKDEIGMMVEDGSTQTSNIPTSTQPRPIDASSLTNTEQRPLLSVDKLIIDDLMLLHIEPIRSICSVREFSTIKDLRKMQSSLPELPFFVTLRELRLHHLGLVDLPNLCVNHSSDSGSFPSLVIMEICNCPNLLSLAEGLFQKPEQFSALEKVKIWDCENLRKLPQGGFSKFISLNELDIRDCPKIEGKLVPECFLPSALQVLHVSNCGDLEANILKALEGVDSLISLVLYGCENIRSLPLKEVFCRWKTLEKLEFSWCVELTSLESLLGLSSVRLLKICGCPKLVSAITSPSAGKKYETEGMVEDVTIQTSNRPASTQQTPADPCSSTNTEHKPLLSVGELEIDDPLLLYIEPIRSLSSVRKLTIEDCSKMQSLPELPPIREELSLYLCSLVLKRRCEESGEDWPKLSHIPKLFISDVFFWRW